MRKQDAPSCCCFVLVNILATMCSGTEVVNMSVCIGDTAQLFHNITYGSRNTVYLFKNNNLLAMWMMRNSSLSGETYMPNVFLNDNFTIYIQNVRSLDEGKYSLQYRTENSTMTFEVQMQALVAPKEDCIPKIAHIDDVLEASLEEETDCGKPVVNIYWQSHHGISSISHNHQNIVQLTQRNEPGTYYACIEGPALKCARNTTPSDYCSNITITERTSTCDLIRLHIEIVNNLCMETYGVFTTNVSNNSCWNPMQNLQDLEENKMLHGPYLRYILYERKEQWMMKRTED